MVEKIKKYIVNRKNLPVILTILFLVLFASIHTALLLKTFAIDKSGNIHTSYDGYGDIPLHMTQISKFAHEPLTDLTDPIYYGSPLKYPFVINFLSGMLLRMTGALRFSVLFPAIFFAVLNILLVFYLYRKMFGKKWLAVVALLLFFLGSGFAGFTQKNLLQQVKTGDYMAINTNLDAVFPQQNTDFTTPLTTAFLYQRSFIIGLTFFLLFILMLVKLKETRRTRYSVLAGLIFGLMPLAHTHTFIAAAIVFGTFLIIEYRTLWKKILGGIILGSVIALPQLFYLVSFNNVGQGFVHFRLGWMTESSIRSIIFGTSAHPETFRPLVHFFFLNFGLLVPVFFVTVCVLLFIAFKNRKTLETKNSEKSFPAVHSVLPYIASAFFLFLAVQTFRFQPWDFDDNKILVYFQFFEIIGIVWLYMYSTKAERPRWIRNTAKICFVIFLFVSLFTGVADVVSHLRYPDEKTPVIYSQNARELAAFISENIPSSELIITSTTHLNPVNGLLGRPVYVGYPGWLWTRALPYGDRENEIKSFYKNPELTNTLFKKFPASYVLFDLQARNDYHADLLIFEKKFVSLFKNNEFELFKITH